MQASGLPGVIEKWTFCANLDLAQGTRVCSSSRTIFKRWCSSRWLHPSPWLPQHLHLLASGLHPGGNLDCCLHFYCCLMQESFLSLTILRHACGFAQASLLSTRPSCGPSAVWGVPRTAHPLSSSKLAVPPRHRSTWGLCSTHQALLPPRNDGERGQKVGRVHGKARARAWPLARSDIIHVYPSEPCTNTAPPCCL